MDKGNMVHIHNRILAIKKKKNKVMPFAATWMDVEIVILTVILSDTERQIYITYMWNLKKSTNQLIYKAVESQM